MPDSLFVHQPPPAAASAASAVDPATPRLAASLMCAPLGALCETGAALLPRCADLPAPAGQEHAAALRGKGGGEDTDEDRQAGRERQGERSYWHWGGQRRNAGRNEGTNVEACVMEWWFSVRFDAEATVDALTQASSWPSLPPSLPNRTLRFDVALRSGTGGRTESLSALLRQVPRPLAAQGARPRHLGGLAPRPGRPPRCLRTRRE